MRLRSARPAGALAVGLSIAVMSLGCTAAQSEQSEEFGDPFIGRWTANLAQSSYDPGPPPPAEEEHHRIFEDWGGGVVYVWNEFVSADGIRTVGARAVMRRDGRDYPLAGRNQEAVVTMAWTMAEPYTAEMTIKADGEVITTLTESVSRDGRTYTVVTKGTNAEGQPFHNVLVFDRQ